MSQEEDHGMVILSFSQNSNPEYLIPVSRGSVVPGHISGIVLLGLLRGKGTPGMFDPVL